MNKRLIPIQHNEALTARGIQINADQEVRDQRRAAYVAGNQQKLIVGISWKSDGNNEQTKYTTNILDWGPILHVPGTTFICLQTGDCAVELAAAIKGFGIQITIDPPSNQRSSVDARAAQIAAMDIVIAPDTDTAMIAAALGIPVLRMASIDEALPQEAIPGMRVFRQSSKDQWIDVIRDVGLALLDCAVTTGAVAKRAPYLRSLAQAFANAGRLGDAEHLYRRLAQEPGLAAEGLHQIAGLKQKTGLSDEAVGLYDQALAADPAFWHAYNGKGVALASLYQFDDAIVSYQRGLTLSPDSGEIHNNLGTSLRCLGRASEALPHYRRAMQLLPDAPSVHLNAASALDECGDVDAALRLLDELIKRKPEYVSAHHNRSQILLASGRFEDGWKEFSWRLKRDTANVRHEFFPQPIWNGENLGGKNILVWTEQGIGDEILTASMVPDAIQHARHVTLLCSERLLPLMRRSFPQATVEPRAEPLPACATDPAVDFQLSLSELGSAFRPSFGDFPKRRSFLMPDTARRDALRAKYQNHRPGTPLIGISWMSQKNYEVGWLKSQNLLDWAPILAAPGVSFVSLQYGDPRREIKSARTQLGVEILHDADIDPLVDMDGFAAQVAAMDLVISVSNTTVHTAGALGVPAWVFLASGRGRFWYWFRSMTNSPWYPSLRFFAQEQPGDWRTPIDRCAAELTAWLEKAEAQGGKGTSHA